MIEFEVNDFDLESTILSGACFRAAKEDDGSFTNILKDRVINIKQEKNKIIVKSSNMDNLKNIIYDYFDLDRNYKEINDYLVQKDNVIKKCISDCKGYKILNQDPFEMCISYIISQNNNVKRISKSINLLCEKYGKQIVFENKVYYLFPKYEVLNELSIDDFRLLGVGFRDKYIKDYLNNYDNLKDINKLSTNDALEKLMQVKGIGLKVASCILLFGYKRLDSFPIDTWVKKYISENYEIENDQKTIKEFTEKKFGNYAGLAIQYMYNSKRNINEE